MNKKHVQYDSNRMNVRLAAETLSLCVANSMDFLRKQRDPSFIEATATITFIKNFNKAFDVFNAKHSDSLNKFKKGLNTGNADEIFQFLDYLSDYIKSIKMAGKEILKTARRTGFL